MRLSLNWAKSLGYTQTHTNSELVKLVNSHLGAVEETDDQPQKYASAIIARVVSTGSHPDADKLALCKIDDANQFQGVDRDGDGLIQVVCGAPNVRAGMLCVWLPPGAVVPESMGSSEFRLDARQIRGQTSSGMLASEKELELGPSHAGILDLTSNPKAKPGQKLMDLLGLNDYIIDIENKMLTNRPDCFGAIGLTRELSAISGQQFISPPWFLDPTVENLTSAEAVQMQIGDVDQEVCQHYSTTSFTEVKIDQSPQWLQSRLTSMGLSSINNIVDLTNYVMMLTAQPVHAFDYDKLAAIDPQVKMGVRMSHKGEKLTLLDGKEIEFDAPAPVIVCGDKPVALAGIMGGAETEVSDYTTRIVLESANFDKFTLRRASFRYGVVSEALTRFNKGLRPEMTAPARAIFAALCASESWAKLSGQVQQSGSLDFSERKVRLNEDKLWSLLGYKISAGDVVEIMGRVEIKTDYQEGEFIFDAPWWRSDLSLAEDFIEEIARITGFDKSPAVLPVQRTRPVRIDQVLSLSNRIRKILAFSGAKELLLYSFTGHKLLKDSGMDPDQAIKINNPLSPELGIYRTAILPGMLATVNGNMRAGYQTQAIFEVGKVHRKDFLGDDGLPAANNHLGFIFSAGPKTAQDLDDAFYVCKNYTVELLAQLGIEQKGIELSREVENIPDSIKPLQSMLGLWAAITVSGKPIGIIGKPNNMVRTKMKLNPCTAVAEIDLGQLLPIVKAADVAQRPVNVRPLPSTDKDLTVVIGGSDSVQNLVKVAASRCIPSDELHVVWSLSDIYQKDPGADKNVTFSFQLQPQKKTLSSAEANEWLTKTRIAFDQIDEVKTVL